MYFAKLYPERTKKVVTLDNLRVPFVTGGKFKILSFRSKDPVFKTDPGVIPPEEVRKKSGIEVIQTGFQHNDMRDTGPDQAKESIEGMLDKFLEDDSPLRPVETKAPGFDRCGSGHALRAGRTDGEEAREINVVSDFNVVGDIGRAAIAYGVCQRRAWVSQSNGYRGLDEEISGCLGSLMRGSLISTRSMTTILSRRPRARFCWLFLGSLLFSVPASADEYPVKGVWVALGREFPAAEYEICFAVRTFGVEAVLHKSVSEIMIFSKDRRYDLKGDIEIQATIKSVQPATQGYRITETLNDASPMARLRQKDNILSGHY